MHKRKHLKKGQQRRFNGGNKGYHGGGGEGEREPGGTACGVNRLVWKKKKKRKSLLKKLRDCVGPQESAGQGEKLVIGERPLIFTRKI